VANKDAVAYAQARIDAILANARERIDDVLRQLAESASTDAADPVATDAPRTTPTYRERKAIAKAIGCSPRSVWRCYRGEKVLGPTHHAVAKAALAMGRRPPPEQAAP